MSSIILELQQMATDRNHDIGDLLRKAKLVATKLKLDGFRQWVDHELNGYGSADVPDYRKARTELHLKNPYYGLVPLVIEDQKTEDSICDVKIRISISSIVHLLVNHSSDRSSLIIPLSSRQTIFLMERQGYAQLPPVRTIGSNKLASIVDSVRTTILEWSLMLEEQGILGDGICFSDDEKKKAASSTEIHIANFQGIIGNVSDSAVTQNLQMNVREGDFESLKSYLLTYKVPVSEIEELRKALEAEPTPKSPNSFGEFVGSWIGKMVGKAASGTWQVGVSAASNLLSAGIRAYYGF